jgi:hypothetical protein
LKSQDDPVWQIWAERLKGWGMSEFAASVLEATGPINLVGAQLVYISQPVLDGIFPAGHLNALASLLEEPEQTEAFVKSLREVDE